MSTAEMCSIDLHTHTTASDGSLTPSELMALARSTGLTAIGVTDHDTLEGLDEAARAAEAEGVELVPGVEISVRYPHGRLHMLGLLLDPAAPGLLQRLELLQRNRRNRNDRMLERMQALGLEITREEVEAEAGGGQIGRPHMAMALLRKGIVGSVKEAFDRYLASGAPAHVPKDKIELTETIELIHEAGGLAILAHPLTLRLEEVGLRSEIGRMRDMGLDGMECYYSQHTAAQVHDLLRLARDLGLVVSGGSDFHGASKPDLALGAVDCGRPAPTALLHAMKERKASRA